MELDHVEVESATLHAASAAKALCAAGAGELHALVMGSNAGSVGEQASKIEGVSKVLIADAAELAGGLAENLAATVVPLLTGNGYSHVVIAATAYGKNLAPRIAATLDVAQISDISAVVSPDTFTSHLCRRRHRYCAVY